MFRDSRRCSLLSNLSLGVALSRIFLHLSQELREFRRLEELGSIGMIHDAGRYCQPVVSVRLRPSASHSTLSETLNSLPMMGSIARISELLSESFVYFQFVVLPSIPLRGHLCLYSIPTLRSFFQNLASFSFTSGVYLVCS